MEETGKPTSIRRTDKAAHSEEKRALVQPENDSKTASTTRVDDRQPSSATVSSASVTPPPLPLVVVASKNNNTSAAQDNNSSGSSGTIESSIGKPANAETVACSSAAFNKRQMEKQHSQIASALPERLQQHKKLKKYASETSFRLSPAGTFLPPKRLDDTVTVPPSLQPVIASAIRHNSNGKT
jgi:hypothetical protein